ncbi:galactose mutarotase-like enzyme [Sinomonas atrocyanea]|nr:galactose mutarotase-like enzyme [Sinomonas atrocyanea]
MTPSPTARRAATGRQHELRRAGAVAVVTELAAGLRSYTRNGVALTETYGDGQIPPGATGITLAPWANRIEDGRWSLDGRAQQLDITEPKHGHASHGLLRNTGYSLLEQTESAVALEAVVFPQHGYPFLLRHRVDYALGSDGGLSVTQTLANDSDTTAPFVLGAHPYLRIGDVPSEELTLTVSGRTRLIADQRLIPRSSEPVSGRADLRRGQPVSASPSIPATPTSPSRTSRTTARARPGRPARRSLQRTAAACGCGRSRPARTPTSSSPTPSRGAPRRWPSSR